MQAKDVNLKNKDLLLEIRYLPMNLPTEKSTKSVFKHFTDGHDPSVIHALIIIKKLILLTEKFIPQ